MHAYGPRFALPEPYYPPWQAPPLPEDHRLAAASFVSAALLGVCVGCLGLFLDASPVHLMDGVWFSLLIGVLAYGVATFVTFFLSRISALLLLAVVIVSWIGIRSAQLAADAACTLEHGAACYMVGRR